MPCPENDEVEAEVTGLSKDGKIAFAATDEYGSVTFALSLDVWSGNGLPQKGEIVVLSEMARFTKGWRAGKARKFVISDE